MLLRERSVYKNITVTGLFAAVNGLSVLPTSGPTSANMSRSRYAIGKNKSV